MIHVATSCWRLIAGFVCLPRLDLDFTGWVAAAVASQIRLTKDSITIETDRESTVEAASLIKAVAAPLRRNL